MGIVGPSTNKLFGFNTNGSLGGFIDPSGTVIVPCQFEEPGDFQMVEL
jgi:hypothetical protein